MVELKNCFRCKQTKTYLDFHKNNSRKDKLNFYCKECYNKQAREKYSSEKTVDRKRKSRYGVDTLWYDEQVIKQNNKCAICKRTQKLCIDHNHETSKSARITL